MEQFLETFHIFSWFGEPNLGVIRHFPVFAQPHAGPTEVHAGCWRQAANIAIDRPARILRRTEQQKISKAKFVEFIGNLRKRDKGIGVACETEEIAKFEVVKRPYTEVV